MSKFLKVGKGIEEQDGNIFGSFRDFSMRVIKNVQQKRGNYSKDKVIMMEESDQEGSKGRVNQFIFGVKKSKYLNSVSKEEGSNPLKLGNHLERIGSPCDRDTLFSWSQESI